MKHNKSVLLALVALLCCLVLVLPASADSVMAGLLNRVATRTGPGTQYDEPGTYFQKDWRTTKVRVINAAWDNINDIWWVQLDFSDLGKKFRAYTGLVRVDVDVNILDKETLLGTTTMRSAAKVYYGPGRDYVEAPFNVPNYTEVKVYGAENGFVQVEYADSRIPYPQRRAWVTAVAVNGQWESPQPSAASPQPATVTVQTSNDAAYKFCPHCGRELGENHTFAFCPYCGGSLTGGK